MYSSSDNDSSTEEESPQTSRGRTNVLRRRSGAVDNQQSRAESNHSRIPPIQTSGPRSDSRSTSPQTKRHLSFTRSRSPAPRPLTSSNLEPSSRRMTASMNLLSRLSTGLAHRSMLPTAIELEVPLWNNSSSMSIYIDARRGAECLILLASTVVAAGKIASLRNPGPAPFAYGDDILWASIGELQLTAPSLRNQPIRARTLVIVHRVLHIHNMGTRLDIKTPISFSSIA